MKAKIIYKFEDFYLDSGSHSFFYDNDEIKLEPRVFDVLHLLLQKPNELITKDDFFEYVWEDKVVSDWALSRAIKILRKTLLEKDSRELIKTLYGKGYLFVSDVSIIEQEAFKEIKISQVPNVLEHNFQKEQPAPILNTVDKIILPDNKPEIVKPNYSFFVGLTILSLIALFILYPSNQQSDSQEKTEIKSIVVLPITNISGSQEIEYLASGLTDVIIGQLAQESSLKVISKTSATHYKNKQMTSRDIADELNVETILEGSIYPDKDKINLSLRLINAESDDLIWSLNETESIQEVYSFFKNTATKVAKRIVPNQSPEKQKLPLYEKTNSETFELYLRAGYILSSRRVRFLQEAEALLYKAIEKDNRFAEAYAKLATVYIVMSSYMPGKRIDWFKLAIEYTDKALQLDPNSSIAWTNLGLIELGYNYNFQAAENAFKKAISIDPNNVDAKIAFSELLAILSNYDKALELLEETWQKDSMNPLLIAIFGSTLMMDKQFDKALKKYELAKSFDGQMIWIERDIAYIHQWQGNDDLSLEFRYLEMKNIGYFANGDQGFITATQQDGILGFWQWRLPLLLNKWQENRLHGCFMAEAYAGIKNYKKMLHWFTTGLEQKTETCFQLVKRSPEFYRFKDEPEFKRLLSNYGISL